MCVCVCLCDVNAQKLVVNNHSATCDYTVVMRAQSPTMHAYAPSTCSAGCNEIYGNIFTIYHATTMSWMNAIDFENGSRGGTAIGWASLECDSFTTVDGISCSTNPWLGCMVSDLTWNAAEIDQGCTDIYHFVCMSGALGGSCGGSPLSSTGATGCPTSPPPSATWTYSGGTVTIDLY